MRCSICDYNEDLGSVYNDSLYDQHHRNSRRFTRHKFDNKIVCSSCMESVADTMVDFSYQDDDWDWSDPKAFDGNVEVIGFDELGKVD